MNKPVRPLALLSVGFLAWAALGCQSESSSPTPSANAAPPSTSTTADTVAVPVQEAQPVAPDAAPDLAPVTIGAQSIPASGFEPAPSAPAPAPADELPAVGTLKQNVTRAVDTLDARVEQTAGELKQKAQHQADGALEKAEDLGKKSVRKGISELKREFGGPGK